MPRFIPSWESYQSPLAAKFPLQLLSPHPRFTFHTHDHRHARRLEEVPLHRVVIIRLRVLDRLDPGTARKFTPSRVLEPRPKT